MLKFSLLLLIPLLCSCGVIDLREKAIATECKVVGFMVEVPSLNAATSLVSVKLGYIVTKYTSTPPGAYSSIEDDYVDVSMIAISGTAKSKLTTYNEARKEYGK